MVVNNETNSIDRIRGLLRDRNGVVLTSELGKLGIPRGYLSILERQGEIQRISRGVYSSTDNITDEMLGIQARFKSAIFSHETALYLLDLTDRTPLTYSVTLPSGYNATALKESGIKVYFVKRSLWQLGSITVKSPHGNDIKTFNLERTLCDVLRSRNQMDTQFASTALKRYVQRKEKNLTSLYNYAKHFGVQKIVREYIEVLL